MLGFKIALTGFVGLTLASLVMHAVGKKMPTLWVAVPTMVVFVASIAAIFVGFLLSVWVM